jgi:hypothetical protein
VYLDIKQAFHDQVMAKVKLAFESACAAVASV